MLKSWYKLKLELELRDDWEPPKLPHRLLREWYFVDQPLDSIFTQHWLGENQEFLTALNINSLVLFYYKDGQVAPQAHVDWRRRWALNFVLEPDGRELTWYPEVPVEWGDPEDSKDTFVIQKRYSPLYPIDPDLITDRLCMDQDIKKFHLVRADVPHHVGIGGERWGFSLYDFHNWDVPYSEIVKGLESLINR